MKKIISLLILFTLSTPVWCNAPWITVWIHGTQPNKFIPYALNVCYCKYGIHKASDIGEKYHYYRELIRNLSDYDADLFPFEHMYLGGWSGALCTKTRKTIALDYVRKLKKIVADYTNQYGERPKLRIITHSHGGNIALNMAHFNDNNPITVDELILLGCPVQRVTAKLIANPMFKKVYSLHSRFDMLQVADVQGWPEIRERICTLLSEPCLESAQNMFKPLTTPFFSERLFTPHEKLTQVYVKSGARGIMHIEWMMGHFIRCLPIILDYTHKQNEAYVIANIQQL